MAITAAQLMILIGANSAPAEAGIGRVAGLLSPGGALAAAGVATAAVVAGIGVASIKMAGDFQAGMTSLVTGAGESRSNLKLVSDGILQMARDTGTSTDQLTSGMYMIESAGFHGAAGLTVLQAAAEGAKVGNADLGTVADATTTIMKDFANTHITASQAVNTLIATVASGKTHMQDLSGALANVLPTASAASIGLNSVMGALATMTGEGVPAADAATYLRQTIIALQAPSKQTQDALAAVGLKSSDVANEMKQSLPDALKMITDAVGKKFPEGSAGYVAALKEISGGSKQMQGVLDLTGQHMKDFQANTENIAGAAKKGGSSITGWADVQGDFNQKMSRAGEVVKTLMIQLGEHLLPVASRLADYFANNLPGAISTVTGAISNIVTTGQRFTAFLEGSSPAALAVKAAMIALGGALAGAAVYGIVTFVASIPALVAGFVTWAGVAWAAAVPTLAAVAPFLAVGAAIALVGVGIYELIQHWSQVSAFFGKVGGIVKQTAQGILKDIGGFFSGIGSTVQAGIKAVEGFVQNGVATVVGWFSWLYQHNYFFADLVNGIRAEFQLAQRIVTTVWAAISGIFSAALGFIRGVVTRDWNALTTIIRVGGTAIENGVHATWSAVTGFLGGLGSTIGSAVTRGVVNPIKAEVTGLVNLAESWGSALLKMFISGVMSQAGALKSAAGNVLGGLGKILGFHSPAAEGPGADADTWAPNLMRMFTAGIQASGPTTAQAAAQVMAGVAGALTGARLGGVGVSGLSAPNPAITQLALSPVAQIAQAGVGGAGGQYQQQIMVYLDSRTLAQGVVSGLPQVVRVGTGLRTY